MSAYAGQTRAEVYKWNHESIMNGRERTPVRLPTIALAENINSFFIVVKENNTPTRVTFRIPRLLYSLVLKEHRFAFQQ